MNYLKRDVERKDMIMMMNWRELHTMRTVLVLVVLAGLVQVGPTQVESLPR